MKKAGAAGDGDVRTPGRRTHCRQSSCIVSAMKQRRAAFIKSLDAAGAKISEKGLIRFDCRVILLTLIVLLLFVLAVSFRLHGSSIGYWDNYFPESREEKTGLVLGSPKAIRSDEWMVSTTWTLSQYKLGYPVKNENIGAHNDPLLTNVPNRHFTAVFKPHHWGFFSLGVERGFAFQWNFKVFGVLISFFFLLMILTGNRFWLSLAGSLWILFSGFTQWWFSTAMPELMVSFALMFIGAAYLLVAVRKPFIIAGGALLAFFTLGFVLFFYPPFQVPLTWLAAFLTLGLLLTGGRWQLLVSRLWLRFSVAAASALLVLSVLYLFYQDAQGTITAVSQTDYPGTRVFQGGDTSLAKMFSGFTGAPFGEKRFPEALRNACEASNYILMFPVVFIAWARNYVLKIKNSGLVSALLVYLFMISAWMLVKFPYIAAKLSLLSYMKPSRALLGLGLASILVTIIYLSGQDREPMNRSFARRTSFLFFVLMILYGFKFDQFTEHWLKYRYMLLMAIFYAVVSYLLLTKRRAAFTVLILLSLTPYLVVNPVAYGLDPIYRNNVVIAAEEIQAREPDARWVEYGGNVLANLLKASGANVVNGNHYTPDLEFYRTLDPDGEHRFIYNRYSDVVFEEPREGSGKEVEFVLMQTDSFAVLIDPCSPLLEKPGITNFAFAYQPKAEKVACLEPVFADEKSNVWFFERKT